MLTQKRKSRKTLNKIGPLIGTTKNCPKSVVKRWAARISTFTIHLTVSGCIVKKSRTPTYAAVLDPRGECLLGLGDMTLHNHITVDLVSRSSVQNHFNLVSKR